MDDLQQLKQDIQEIKQRNARVELDKAWETSGARKALVAILTYAVVVLFFIFAHLSKPWVNAIVPTMGFLLSTLSVGYVKRLWVEKRWKK